MATFSKGSVEEYQNKLQGLIKQLKKYPKALFSARVLAPIVIHNCNGTGSWPFTSATLDYSLEPGIPICHCFHSGIKFIIKRLTEKERPSVSQIATTVEQENAFGCLLNFISQEKHKKCLSSLKEKRSEAEIQAILAIHLFTPLVFDSTYIIDANHFSKHNRSCPSCHEKINLGNTSFGDVNIWHGFADILIQRSTVKVDTEQRVPADGDGCIDLEADDKDDYSDVDEENKEEEFEVASSKKQTIAQALAQTIVSAFCEVKNNPSLSKSFIPSFLAIDRTITLNMYNCCRDMLLTSEPLMIWNNSEPDSLDISTLISVWLAINFDKFKLVGTDVSQELGIPVSNFQKIVSSKLAFYSEKVSRPLENVKEEVFQRFEMSPDVFKLELCVAMSVSKLLTEYAMNKDIHTE